MTNLAEKHDDTYSGNTDSGEAISFRAQSWQNILNNRAEELAKTPDPHIDTEYIQVVTFLLGYETYGIETYYVREVYPLKDLTPLPCTPAFVIGIVNVRGQVISVIDIKRFFELPEQGLTDLNKIIILSGNDMEFGILADAVHEISSIPRPQIQPSLPTLTGIREQYLLGVTSERLIILDADSLLTSRNIVVHEDA